MLLAVGPLRADDYVDGLVARARAERLAEDPEWRTLGHYRAGLAGWVSLVDDPNFFLAPAGKRDPAAELEADLRAFFAPADTNEHGHAVCRFPARFDWLKARIGIDEARLPVPRCGPYEKTVAALKPSSVALVYPAAYMNGPASMFGHTLLVFDGEGKNRLLSRAVSYAARTRPTIGPLFAFAGIFGFYPGYYAYQPYYEKTQQYGDLGHRDVWEYELDLSPAEIDRMLRHAWELQGIFSRYFFFDENCAYNLLYLLDVARPALALTRRMPWFVIPIDTVRAVDQAGLVRSVTYRPSPVTAMYQLAGRLGPAGTRQALELARGRTNETAAADPDTRRVTLDLATEYVKYLHAEQELATDAYRPRLLSLLRERSTLGKANDPDAPVPPRPDLGHAPARITLGGGTSDGEPFGVVRYRLANHALEDNDDGFTRGAQIQFLNTEARWTEDELRLQRLDLVDVFSIAPRDELFRPSSWKVRFGLERDPVDADQWMAGVNTGAGLAGRAMGCELAWAFIEAEAGWRESFAADYEVALGPALGLMKQVGPDWKHLLQARLLYAGLAEDAWLWSASWVQDFRVRRNLSLGTEARWDEVDGQSRGEALLRCQIYF